MQVPEMELEVFVHGALCMAYSGRCLLSGYINKRDPNQGTCTNSCRWEYKGHEGKEDDVGQIVHRREPIAVQRWIRPWGPASRATPWCCWRSPTARASS